MTNTRNLAISTSRTRFGPWAQEVCTLEEFYSRLATPARGQEIRSVYLALNKRRQDDLKDVGGFVGGILTGGVRRNGHVATRCLITLDVDKVEAGGTQRVIDSVARLGCGYIIYSTRKHCPESPRLRVVVPVYEDLAADEYEPCARMLAYCIDQTMQMFDRTTFEAARLMYWPSVCADGEYICVAEDKPLLDAKAVLAMYGGKWNEVSAWPRCYDEEQITRSSAEKQQDPTEKEGVIGAFCRTYDVHAAISTFLSSVYAPVQNMPDRYTFLCGSTTAGAIVYGDGKFLYSHHATDPAGGQLCNAFDLVRLHLFSELDNDAKPGTPVSKLPSFVAMTKFAEQDKATHEQVITDRQARLERDFGALLVPAGQAAGNAPGDTAQAVSAVAEAVSREVAELLEEGAQITTDVVQAAMSLTGVSVRRDEITNRVRVYGLPQEYSVQEASNTVTVFLSDVLKKNKIRGAAPSSLTPYVSTLADRNRFNPVADWLSRGWWDGVDRFETLYEILGIEDSEEYCTYVRKWLMQCIAMALNSETHPIGADGLLVLQGPQGCGKTMFFKKLSMCPEWFAEGVSIDVKDKDTLIRALGAWITELGELDSTLKREQSALKAFITQGVDEIRVPYAAAASWRVRRTSLCGTVNPERFIRDDTGSRRYWVVPVQDIDTNRLLSLSPEFLFQMWQQAKALWQADQTGFRLTREERERLEANNMRFSHKAQFQEEIEDLMDFDLPVSEWQWITAAGLGALVRGFRVSAESAGRALTKIAESDSRVEKKRTKAGIAWLIPLRKCYIMQVVS